MKTTKEVVSAVQNKEAVTELELKCALIAMHSYLMNFYMDLAGFCAEVDEDTGLQPKTIRGLKRAWKNQEWLDRDLETFIINSSRSPLLSREEQKEKFIKHTSETAANLLDVLSNDKKI